MLPCLHALLTGSEMQDNLHTEQARLAGEPEREGGQVTSKSHLSILSILSIYLIYLIYLILLAYADRRQSYENGVLGMGYNKAELVQQAGMRQVSSSSEESQEESDVEPSLWKECLKWNINPITGSPYG